MWLSHHLHVRGGVGVVNDADVEGKDAGAALVGDIVVVEASVCAVDAVDGQADIGDEVVRVSLTHDEGLLVPLPPEASGLRVGLVGAGDGEVAGHHCLQQ